jgi:mono/diheme cytochrome c family protein
MKKYCFILILLALANASYGQTEWVVPESEKSVVNPYAENQIATQKGAQLFSKLCWTCHGKTGQGDGPAGANLMPKPKNFSLESVQNQTDGELYWKLSNGNGMMIPYKHSLSKEQLWQLVNFIRTLKQ